jgi:transposase
MVPWARAGSSYTRDFEDVVAFLAQQMAKTPLAKLRRVGWRSVGEILARVVADKLDRGRLDGFVMLGVEEISHGAGHRFLTCVADHQTGGVVWAAQGRNAQTLQGFFTELSDEQKQSITAVSIDMSAGYEKALRAPERTGVLRPVPVCQLAGNATDQVRRDEYNRHGRSTTGEEKWIKGTCYSLLKDTANQTPKQLVKLAEVVLTNKSMYRAFLLNGELRYIYRLPKDEAAERLDAWLAWASRSKLKPFIKLARTIREHRQGVLAAIEFGINNGRLERSTAASDCSATARTDFTQQTP